VLTLVSIYLFRYKGITAAPTASPVLTIGSLSPIPPYDQFHAYRVNVLVDVVIVVGVVDVIIVTDLCTILNVKF
jgi:hypothetical protein